MKHTAQSDGPWKEGHQRTDQPCVSAPYKALSTENLRGTANVPDDIIIFLFLYFVT